jgi:putative tricarboxylic transport membrane protein
MKLHDVLTAALLIAFGLAVAGYASTFPPMSGQAFGPGFFPTLVAGGIVLSGLVLLGGAVRRRAAARLLEVDDWVCAPRRLLAMLLLLGGVVGYLLLSEPLGYLLTAPIALLAFMFATGVRVRVGLPVALLVPLLVHYIFYSALRVPLPWGLLTDYAW